MMTFNWKKHPSRPQDWKWAAKDNVSIVWAFTEKGRESLSGFEYEAVNLADENRNIYRFRTTQALEKFVEELNDA